MGPLIHQGKWFRFRAASKQVDAFLTGLSGRDLTDFKVAARILENSVQSGRPPAGRSERIRGSKKGLFGLRITPPGRKGPHLRMLYVLRGREVVCLRGLTKTQSSIPRREIKLAERALLADEQRIGKRRDSHTSEGATSV
jgi:hypothetical protein